MSADYQRRPSLPGSTAPAGHGLATTSAPSLRQRAVSPAPPPSAVQPSPISGNDGPMVFALPDMATLASEREAALNSGLEEMKLKWAADVVGYVEREHGTGQHLTDAILLRYVDEAMAVINRRASANPPDAKGLYLRGDLKSTGNFPAYHAKDPKNAFNDFELSGRMGHPPSWLRIGRDYETLNDIPRGRDAYERGQKLKDVGCTYRLGMAYLLGQLNLKQDFPQALALLKLAADDVSAEAPSASFIYGMLFTNEFAYLNIPAALLQPQVDPAEPRAIPTADTTALRYIQTSAYFHHAPALTKLGSAYEYASLGCAFDPLLSVQYYSLASKAGDVEADLAVSKWLLCGAEGYFDKNEALAYTFAEKAAKRGLASAAFALAYYYEVGVGCEQNIDLARSWYRKAAAHGNIDASERLAALDASSGQAISRSDHQARLDGTLIRKHTAAKNASRQQGRSGQGMSRSHDTPSATPQGGRTTDMRRTRTMRMVNDAARGGRSSQIPQHAMEPVRAGTPLSSRPSPSNAGPMSPQRTAGSNTSGLRGSSPAGVRIASPAPSSAGPAQPRPQGYRIDYEGPRPTLMNPNAGRTPGSRPTASSAPGGSSAHRPGPSSSTGRPDADGRGPLLPPPGGEAPTKFNTFQEMGFKSTAQSNEKDCIIM